MSKKQNSKRLANVSTDELLSSTRKALDECLLDHAVNLVQILTERLSDDDAYSTELRELITAIKDKRTKKLHHDILIVGDSLSLPSPERLKTYHPISNPFLSTNLENTYPLKLEYELSKNKPLHTFRVTNLSKRGYTVRDLVDMRHDIFCWHNPDIVIFHVGLVDAFPRGINQDEQKTSLNDFKKFFKLIMDFRNEACPTKKCIFIDITPSDENISSKYPIYQTHVKNYNQVFKDLLNHYTDTYCIHMDNLFDINSPYELLHYDGQHLSLLGHKKTTIALTHLILSKILC